MSSRSWAACAVAAAAVAALSAGFAGPAAAQPAPSAPTPVDGALDPGSDSGVRAVNDRGDVVGDWFIGQCCRQPPHGFVRTAGGAFTRLDDPAGEYPSSEAVAITRAGVVAGSLIAPRRVGLWPSIPFTWTAAGGFTRLPAPEGETAARAVAVSGSGRVLVNGQATNAVYVYTPNGSRYMRLPDAGEGASAAAMNDRGDVVGAVNVGGHRHAALWTWWGHLTILHRDALGTDTEAVGVNAWGQVIGTATTASDAGTTRRSLYWPSAWAAPAAVDDGEFAALNDQGCIVGARPQEGATATTVWRPRRGGLEARVLDLPPATGDPYGGFRATALNNRGLLGGVLAETTPAKLVDHAAIAPGGC